MFRPMLLKDLTNGFIGLLSKLLLVLLLAVCRPRLRRASDQDVHVLHRLTALAMDEPPTFGWWHRQLHDRQQRWLVLEKAGGELVGCVGLALRPRSYELPVRGHVLIPTMSDGSIYVGSTLCIAESEVTWLKGTA